MNKLILGTMLAVGLCYGEEHCELVKNYVDNKYRRTDIICLETQRFDSVKYEIYLVSNKIDIIIMNSYENEMKYIDKHDLLSDECVITRDTVDEYEVITGSSENHYSAALCERRFRYVWNELKKLGTYK